MRSICSSAVRCSVAASFSRRRSKAARISALLPALDRHDEREAEARLVRVVERGEARALGVGQAVEAGAGLLLAGIGGQPPGAREAAGEVGMGVDQRALLRVRGLPQHGAERPMQAGRRYPHPRAGRGRTPPRRSRANARRPGRRSGRRRSDPSAKVWRCRSCARSPIRCRQSSRPRPRELFGFF